MFCTFWLWNVLRATAACHFSTSELQKDLRSWCALYILTWKRASCHTAAYDFWHLLWAHGSAPATLVSFLFQPPDPRIIEKTHRFATFVAFRASVSSFFWLSHTCNFFLLTLLLCSAFQLSILSKVRLQNFLRLHTIHDNSKNNRNNVYFYPLGSEYT